MFRHYSLITLHNNPTAQDIQLIQLFQAYPDKRVHREKIAEKLWGEKWLDHYSDWAITKAISRLREKIPAQIKIITIKNYGYELYFV